MVTDKRLVKSIVPVPSLSPFKSTVIFMIINLVLGLHTDAVTSFPQNKDITPGKSDTNNPNEVSSMDIKPLDKSQTSISHGGTEIIGHFETIAGEKNGGNFGGGETGNPSDALYIRERRWGGCGYKGIIGC